MRLVRGFGRSLILAGVLVLLFVAFQLWGTGLREARAQDSLRNSFEEELAAATAATATTRAPDVASPTTTAPPVATTVPPRPVEGDAVAIIEIPRIGVDKAVVEGVGRTELQRGPGHYPDTPMPGQPGNAAIAGHRTTYGAPFSSLDQVAAGDDIVVTTRQGRFRYVVDRTSIVTPEQVEVVAQGEESRLTLTTCHPRFSARQRLVVSGVLAGDPAPAPPPEPPEPDTEREPGQGTVPPEDDPVVAEDVTEVEDLSGDPGARPFAIAWGTITALVGLAVALVGRHWRRLPAYLIGVPVFLVVLFVFYEQLSRLLPANI